ncbi:MAG: hypothetical protein ACOX6D_02690 [Thermoguttaceae bacterium]|jgi:hypothetical protein
MNATTNILDAFFSLNAVNRKIAVAVASALLASEQAQNDTRPSEPQAEPVPAEKK